MTKLYCSKNDHSIWQNTFSLLCTLFPKSCNCLPNRLNLGSIIFNYPKTTYKLTYLVILSSKKMILHFIFFSQRLGERDGGD